MMCRLIFMLFTLYLTAWSSRIKEVFNFKQVYFTSDETLRNDSKLEPVNAMPMALERWENKLFLVTPRFKLDIPVTLSYINITSTILLF